MSLPCGRGSPRRTARWSRPRTSHSPFPRSGVAAREGARAPVASAPSCRRDAHGDGLRLDLHLEGLDLSAIAAVELVQDLAVELDVDLPRARDTDERGP